MLLYTGQTGVWTAKTVAVPTNEEDSPATASQAVKGEHFRTWSSKLHEQRKCSSGKAPWMCVCVYYICNLCTFSVVPIHHGSESNVLVSIIVCKCKFCVMLEFGGLNIGSYSVGGCRWGVGGGVFKTTDRLAVAMCVDEYFRGSLIKKTHRTSLPL